MTSAFRTIRASLQRFYFSPEFQVVFCPLGLATLLALTKLAGRSGVLIALLGVQDFTGFYIGGKLLGANPYDIQANLALQEQLTGFTDPGIIFIRPPFFAAAMKLFTLLPYYRALIAWKATMLLALAVFAVTFPVVKARWTTLALFWSCPIISVLTMSQDVPLIMLCLALALQSWRRGHPNLAGACIALCLAKFHLMIFMPLLLLKREHWRALPGFVAMAGSLVAVCFWVQPNWIAEYWAALHMPARNMNGGSWMMPNFYSLFERFGHPGIGVALGIVVVGALLFLICRYEPMEFALPLYFLGGVLATYHSNFADASLFIPALLVCPMFRRDFLSYGVILLSPLPYLGVVLEWVPFASAMMVFPCLILLIMLARRDLSKLHYNRNISIENSIRNM